MDAGDRTRPPRRRRRDEIAAELERDNTISGQESAAAARAIRPTAEAKEEAWQRAAVDPTTPNETRRNIAMAFQVAGQADVLEPFVDRYLEMAETIVDDHGVWIGQVALMYLFPLANPSQTALDKVDAWLASTSAAAAATRYVSEGRDDLARALRAQRRSPATSSCSRSGTRPASRPTVTSMKTTFEQSLTSSGCSSNAIPSHLSPSWR